jgi:hypothetical protein
MPDTIAALNPAGFAPKATRKDLAPRLATLEGKSVVNMNALRPRSPAAWPPSPREPLSRLCPRCPPGVNAPPRPEIHRGRVGE